MNVLLPVALLGVVGLSLVGVYTARKAVVTSDQIAHNVVARDDVRGVLSALKDAETGQRGFLITGLDGYLTPYDEGLKNADRHLAELRRHSDHGILDATRVAKLESLVAEKRSELEQTIAARRKGPDAEAFLRAREIVTTDRGRQLMESIRDVSEIIIAKRDEELAQLQDQATLHETRNDITIGGALLLTLGTFVAATMLANLERKERRISEHRLEREQARMLAIVNASMDAVVAVDHESNIIMLNPTAEGLFQTDDDALVGQPFSCVVAKRFQNDFATAMRSSSGTEGVRTQVKNGNIIHGVNSHGDEFPAVAVVSRAMVDNQSLFTIMLKDVSERETGRVRMREQAAILSRIRDSIHVRNLHDRIQIWNEGAEQLYGWTSDEAVGKPGSELLQGSSEEDEDEILKSVMADGVWIGERNIRTQSGEELIIESRRSLIVDDDGNPTSQLFIDIDITEDKRREQAERRSQRLESIGTMASGIAHDLNNVLTPITMGAKLLRRTNRDEQRSGLIDTITASAERGANMIRQLLSFAGGTSGPRENIDMKELITETCGILNHTLTQTISVESDVDKSLWQILGDGTELSQVLMNLAINARDAMPNGGTLSFKAENVIIDSATAEMELSSGRYVRVSVADTGTGMSNRILERIFDPFYTTKEQGKGTGLGLATCLGIVKSHEGNMTVQSEVGRGTKFTFYLPSRRGDAEEAVGKLASRLPEGRGEKILLVDDETAILQMLQATLESYGYNTISAEGGAAAIALFEQLNAEIDLVIVDMMMPETDGRQVMKKLKSIRSDLPIIASSGLKKPLHGEPGIDGSHAFLAKPYSDEQLLQTVKRVLGTVV